MTENDQGLKLLGEGKVLDAVTALRSAAWSDPSYKSYLNLAVALRHAGQFDSALEYLYKCVKIDDYLVNAWLAFANTYTDMGEFGEAMFSYEAAWFRINQQPNVPIEHVQQVAIGYSQALLRNRQFSSGWPLWELGRYERSYWRLPDTKRWLGEPCDCLLVICEGGYGDAMAFARWLPFAKAKAKWVKLILWDPLVKFRDWRWLGVDEVLPKSESIAPGGIDYTTSWMSLPGLSGLDRMEDIPSDRTFTQLRTHVCNRIGFCWRAEEAGTLRKPRSLPADDAESIAKVLAEYGQVVSLVPKGKSLYRPDSERWPVNVAQDESLLSDWLTTASTICSCAFVVTVDTAVAHLSGLCGVPTLLLLPAFSDWKWGLPDNTPVDPWYGPHVKYFRNLNPLKWNVEAILEEVSSVC
jgi:tetratricopeptide (TPR) repeat protein